MRASILLLSALSGIALAIPFAEPGPKIIGRQAAGWTPLGCYTDAQAARALKYNGNVPGGPGAVTWESCTQACQQAGLPYAGVEYGGECYCDDKINNQGPAPDGDKGCNMNCKGDQSEICGGADRINLFYYGAWSNPNPPCYA